jgi:hypothetical protein
LRSRGASAGIFITILFLTAVVGLFVVSYRYTSHNHGDERFVAYWAGMRNWLVNGASPYSDATAAYVQRSAVSSGDSNARVAYPLYGGFIFLPYAAIPDYALARALWMTTLGITLLLTALFCLRLTGWRSPAWLLALFLLLAVTGFPGLSLLISGNVTILAALFLVAALDAMRLGRDTTAGVLLALSTLQPLVGMVALPLMLAWAFNQRRWLVVIWFFGLLAVLSAIGAFFIPTWIIQWLRNLLHYSEYYAPATPGAAFQNWWPGIGRQAGLLFTGLMVVSLFSEWWSALRREYRGFLWTVGMTFIVAQWVGVPAGMENFMVLLLPLATVVSVFEERGGKSTRMAIVFILLVVYGGTWGLYFAAQGGQLRPAMLFLPPLVLLVLTYYVKWWATRPQPLLAEELKQQRDS